MVEQIEIPVVREVGKEIPRMTYYAKDGTAMVLLADAYHMTRYLGRGFTLTPPEKVAPQTDAEFECETCGKTFTKKIALAGHKRSHK